MNSVDNENFITNLLATLSAVTSKIDFVSRFPQDLLLLNALQAKLLAVQQEKGLSLNNKAELVDFLKSKVVPTLNDIIKANTNILNMGQLDLQRTITPEQAVEENKILDSLTNNIQQLISHFSS